MAVILLIPSGLGSPKRHSRHSDNEDDYERDQHGSSDPSKRVEAAIYNLGNEVWPVCSLTGT